MANRILVVDDNSDIRENICEYLNLRGHQTIGASDAASAAQLIAEEDIALIVLDVGLPGEDGMSFCRRLRLAGSSILILMLTARGTKRHDCRCVKETAGGPPSARPGCALS